MADWRVTPPEDPVPRPERERASWRVSSRGDYPGQSGDQRDPLDVQGPGGRNRRGYHQQTSRRRKDVPTMPTRRRDTQVRSPALTVAGALLIALLAILAFAGGQFFGRVPLSSPTPSTPLAILIPTSTPPPTVVIEPTRPAFETPIPLPAAFARAPVICLDPGHGGPDRGFIRYGPDGSVQMEEAPLVLAEALALRSRLEHHSYQVVMTRETDAAVNESGRDVNGDGRTAAHDRPGSERNQTIDELQARINVCNEAGADLLVSLHLNGYSTGRPRGYETWFTRERPFGDRNAAIATLVYAHLKEQLGAVGYVIPVEEERGVLPDTTADVQREEPVFQHFIMTGPAVPGIVSPSMMPGLIGEALFLSNDEDAALLATAGGQNAIVTAYELAIVEYFGQYPPSSAPGTPNPA